MKQYKEIQAYMVNFFQGSQDKIIVLSKKYVETTRYLYEKNKIYSYLTPYI